MPLTWAFYKHVKEILLLWLKCQGWKSARLGDSRLLRKMGTRNGSGRGGGFPQPQPAPLLFPGGTLGWGQQSGGAAELRGGLLHLHAGGEPLKLY